MSKRKYIFIFISLILFILTVFIYLKSDNANFDQRFQAYLSWHNPTDTNLNNFYEISKSQYFFSTLNTESREFENNMELYDFLRSEQNLNKNTAAILKQNREVKVPIAFTEIEGVDLNMPEQITYIIPGQIGYDVYNYDLLLFSPSKEILSSKYLNTTFKTIAPISKKILTGKKDISEAKLEVTQIFNQLMIDLDSPELLLEKGIKLSDENLLKLSNKEILQNVSINEITIVQKDFSEDEYKNDTLEIGSINIRVENCYRDFSSPIQYSINKGEFTLQDINNFVKNLCKKQFIKENGYFIGTCEDCTYYPADKTHALRSDYAPSLTSIGFAPGNQIIYTKAYQDFYDLYNAAKKDGAYIFVTSGYRSYATQVATFNAWVASELALGHSQSDAERIANTYSAKPGFSEHQLGTALDLNGAGCGDFIDGGCSSNQTVWNWLAKNAYKYGFVQSYPEGKISETGYTTEAWHYRWIGKELALEYKNAGGGTEITLNRFLLEKGNY